MVLKEYNVQYGATNLRHPNFPDLSIILINFTGGYEKVAVYGWMSSYFARTYIKISLTSTK